MAETKPTTEKILKRAKELQKSKGLSPLIAEASAGVEAYLEASKAGEALEGLCTIKFVVSSTPAKPYSRSSSESPPWSSRFGSVAIGNLPERSVATLMTFRNSPSCGQAGSKQRSRWPIRTRPLRERQRSFRKLDRLSSLRHPSKYPKIRILRPGQIRGIVKFRGWEKSGGVRLLDAVHEDDAGDHFGQQL
jgi:hypothetical protein